MRAVLGAIDGGRGRSRIGCGYDVTRLPRRRLVSSLTFLGACSAASDSASATWRAPWRRKHTAGRVVTKAMREVEFAPVHGDLVSFCVKTVARGRTSVTVEVRVDAQRTGPTGNRDTVYVTSAPVAYVAVDGSGLPVPLDGPPAE